MDFSFRSFVEAAYPHELPLLHRLPKMDMYSQAAEDQKIHDRAINKGAFNAFGNNFLANDKEIKQRFQDLLLRYRNHEKIEPRERAAVAKMIHDDQQGHWAYIARKQFSPDTGSEEWHRAWINVYDRWLQWLDAMGTGF